MSIEINIHGVVPDALLSRLSEFVALHTGLYFPEERRRDLERGIMTAAREFHYKDVDSCIQWLLSSPLTKRQVEVLASHLTVGETYFFREKKSFQVLEERILPELIRSRKKNGRHLRIWSAGCCTGEEPYSIAVLLHKLLPDLSEWNVTLLATDMNPHFLHKAETGVYGEWSFRETPPWVKEKYFRKTKNGKYEILPHIKKMVSFSYLNLAEDVYPSLLNNTNAMDVIFCRNVLMYFAPDGAEKAVRNFYRCLLDGGWLFISSGEISHTNFPRFVTVNFPDIICYKKDSRAMEQIQNFKPHEFLAEAESDPAQYTPQEMPFVFEEAQNTLVLENEEQDIEESPRTPYEKALRLYEKGQYEEAGRLLLNSLSEDAVDAHAMALLSRVYANLGKLDEALSWCDTAIAADKLVAAFHYLKAIILQEQRQAEEAVASLRRALYLDTHFVLAHFSLGNLTRQIGRLKESQKHYVNVLSLLTRMKKDELLPESEGLTAGRLMEIVQANLESENGVRPLRGDF